jgi:cytochrome c-type biogenesis protein
VGPILGSVLAFAAGAGSSGQAALYLALYALGLTLPLIAVSLVAPLALRWLDRAKRHLRIFEWTTGTLLAAMGLLFITGHEGILMGTSGSAAPPTTPVVASAPAPAPVTCGTGVLPAPAPAFTSTLSRALDHVPTMVEFVSAGCPICQRMHPVVRAAEQGCSHHGIQVRQLDVSSPEGRAEAARWGVLGVPTFLFLDGAGKEVARLVGEQPQAVLKQSLEVLAGEECDGFRLLPDRPLTGS